MAIKIVSGVPGSGKTYYAVNHVVTKHYKWCDDEDAYVAKHKLLLITNIDDLRLEHWSLESMLEKYGVGLEEFFTVPFMEKLALDFPDHRIVIMLDEAQRQFPAGYRNTDVLYYFQWHRHLGHDVYLMVQTSESLCKHIVALIEFEIKAVRESVKMGKNFKYNFMAGDLQVGDKSLPHNNKIFGLYTSFKKEDQGDKVNPLRKAVIKLAVLLVVILVICVFAYKSIRKTIVGDAQADPVQGQQHIEEPKNISLSAHTLPGSGKRSGSGREADARSAFHSQARKLPVKEISTLHPVGCGGLWVGKRLVAVQLFGDLVTVRDLPYNFTQNAEDQKVTVYVPAEVLAQVQPLLPAGSQDLYRDKNGELNPVGSGSRRQDPEEQKFRQDQRESMFRFGGKKTPPSSTAGS